MPTVTEQTIDAYAHCNRARCPGNSQAPVQAIRVETGYTYAELGGDMPGLERSHVTLRFADGDEIQCPHCGGDREVTDQARISYAPLSGHDPMGLLNVKFDPAKQVEIRHELQAKGVDPDKVALEQQNELLGKQLAEMQAQIDALTSPPEEPS